MIVKTCYFLVSQTGLCFQGEDKNKCYLLNVNLPAQIFDGYLCDADISMGIYVPDFYKIIKLAYKYGGITISDSDDPNQIRVEFTSEAGAQRAIDIQSMTVEEVKESIPVLI